MKDAAKRVADRLLSMTDEEFMASLMSFVEERQRLYGNIPKDKDCKKCPHSKDGEWLGMVTPCFDVCGELFSEGDDNG